MTTIDTSSALTPEQERLIRSRALGDWLARFAIGALMMLSGFVIFEPAPYELVSAALIPVFLLAGIAFPAELMRLTMLLFAFFLGGIIAAFSAPDFQVALVHVLVTGFLSLTAIFFAVLIFSDPARRLHQVLVVYAVCAVLVSIPGILAYFGLMPFADSFLLYGRVKSTFKDPNVYSAFLALPMTYGVLRIMTGNLRSIFIWSPALVVMAIGLFLSFSRGAWGVFVLSAFTVVFLAFVTSRSKLIRTRIVLFSVSGFALLAAILFSLLSLDRVGEVFQERARFDQSYDIGEGGRFSNQLGGLNLIIENPLGVGFKGFTEKFGADPHNVYMQGFLTYSWLGGFAYFAIVCLTLGRGLMVAVRETPWRPYVLAIYSTFLATSIEGMVIDTDHWRHWFLMLGLLWGVIAADRRMKQLQRLAYSLG